MAATIFIAFIVLILFVIGLQMSGNGGDSWVFIPGPLLLLLILALSIGVFAYFSTFLLNVIDADLNNATMKIPILLWIAALVFFVFLFTLRLFGVFKRKEIRQLVVSMMGKIVFTLLSFTILWFAFNQLLTFFITDVSDEVHSFKTPTLVCFSILFTFIITRFVKPWKRL